MVIPPAMAAIYEDDHPFLVMRKPTQVGATELNLNLALHAAATGYAERGVVLYALPTGDFAARISQVRLAGAINASPELRRLAAREREDVVRSAGNVYRRTFGKGVIYFTGVEAETQYSGIDADLVIADEYDLMDEDVISSLQSRLRSSRAGRTVVTSTPTVEAYGISRLFEGSDARHYELECAACGGWQAPQFPGSVNWERTTVVCTICGADLDPWRPGRWVAERPEMGDIRGYQLSRLVLPNPPLAQMRQALGGTIPTTKETFYRHELGVPWVSEDARLVLDDLARCVSPWKLNEVAFRFRRAVMGVDVGKRLHVVVRGYFEGRWHLHYAVTCTDFEELDGLFDRFNVQTCVVDALPESRAASAFYRRHPDRVRLCLYVQQGIGTHWDHADGIGYVRVPRTLAMDEMLYRVKSGEFALPPDFREIAGGEYVAHLLAPVRVIEPDAFGQPLATYKHTRPDDFAHAEVYAALATERAFDSQVYTVQFNPMRFTPVNLGPHPDLVYVR